MDETKRTIEEEGGTGESSASDHDALEGKIREELKNVIDPELGINIVDLGLVYDIQIDGDTARVEYTLTTMGCPIGPLIESQMKQTLAGIEGIDNLEAEMVFSPPWSPEKMSEEAKAALGVI